MAKAGKTSKSSKSKGTTKAAKAPKGPVITADPNAIGQKKAARAAAVPKGKAAKAPKADPKLAKKQAEEFKASLETPEGREGADENTGQLRNRDVAPPTPNQVAQMAAQEAGDNAARRFPFEGRVRDSADGPSEAIAPRTAYPHPYTGTQVDRTGGIAEITHRAGVYGMDSRDYGARLETLAEAVGAGKDDSMDPRDRWTRLVALHDLLIDRARSGNSVAVDDDLVSKAGLATGGRKAGGKTIDNVEDILAQVGLLPGDL
jgi:hypothetical protein